MAETFELTLHLNANLTLDSLNDFIALRNLMFLPVYQAMQSAKSKTK